MIYPPLKSSLTLQDRYFIASANSTAIAFPADLVRDIIAFERRQILVLPTYDSALLGIFYYQNEIVPAVCTKKVLNIAQNNLLQSNLVAIRLNESAGKLANIALVVDRMEKSLAADELSSEYQFKLEDIPEKIWQPQY